MKATETFTKENELELIRIAKLDVFASKIALTILSKKEFRASSKQVTILNEVSLIKFVETYKSNPFYYDDMIRNYHRKAQLPSSMR